ncbi:MAG: DMT family transporter, partial [Bdellovibrionales bacterium]|nr:DMT family transporter [Bdellovibrionales bacterium]
LDGPATSKVVAITSAYPLITVLSSWLILSEKISLSGISGIVLVFVGVILLADGGSKSSTERAVNVHLQATSSAVHGEVVLQKTSAHSREDLPQIVSYKEAA